MSALDATYHGIFQAELERDYVPHLPAILEPKCSAEKLRIKNLSRACSAFALTMTLDLSREAAANAVVDDYVDFGIDAIYYHAPSETLYLVQGKNKTGEQFKQEDALRFEQGIRKLIRQELDAFNNHFQRRRAEIEQALDDCSQIQLILIYTGPGFSVQADTVLNDLLNDESHGEDRLVRTILHVDGPQITSRLRDSRANPRVDADLEFQKYQKINEPREAHIGLVQLKDLAQLHITHGDALYERNIRSFMGHKTDVNASMRDTLQNSAVDFFFLNNGVTALALIIEPKGNRGGKKKVKIKGLSIINGAQTISTCTRLIQNNPTIDVDQAKVLLTLVKTDPEGEFGKSITRARNHQNPVHYSNFVALDPIQEKIRRELALINYSYVYRAGEPNTFVETKIYPIEAAHAVGATLGDPRFPVWAKKDAFSLLDTSSSQYRQIFDGNLPPTKIVNSVQLYRYVTRRMQEEERNASGRERLCYKHGVSVMNWILAKRLRDAISSPRLFTSTELQTTLSADFDTLRQTLWVEVQQLLQFRGPLAIFRSMTDTLSVIEKVLIGNFSLANDPVLVIKRGISPNVGEPYPLAFFKYLGERAPQIGVGS